MESSSRRTFFGRIAALAAVVKERQHSLDNNPPVQPFRPLPLQDSPAAIDLVLAVTTPITVSITSQEPAPTTATRKKITSRWQIPSKSTSHAPWMPSSAPLSTPVPTWIAS